MEAVGGSVLSTTLQVMFDCIALNKNFLLGLFPGNKKIQLKRLMRVLQIVSQVLQDAENEQEKSPAVKSWFNSLKHAVYQADDVLDEINTGLQHSKGHPRDTDFSDQFVGELSSRVEEICDALEINNVQNSTGNLSDTDLNDTDFNGTDFNDTNFSDQFIGELSPTRLDEICEASEINTIQHSTGNLSDNDFRDQFIGELSQRLEKICDALERKVQHIGILGLEILHGKQKREDKMPSTSEVKPSQIWGRDDEKEKIIQMVLSGEGGTDISVIPITGMAGIGKTTLAQLVYNDERVKNHFKTRAWACVSEEFDVYKITKDLLMEVNSSPVDLLMEVNSSPVDLLTEVNSSPVDLLMEVDSSPVNEKDDLNNLQVKLKKNLEQKRFIIILDDIWNDNFNDYQCLMTPLKSGSRGSKIIVTTRNENIALMLQTEPFHHLKPISDDQSWSLFKLHAFDNRSRTLSHEFVTIGKTMAERCKGLPLAIKTVAGALRSKEDIREWRDISSNENWMAEGDILPALRLSYKLLPSHLKCCFAFCAVFPKDVPFKKEKVTQLWITNDLVPPSNQRVAQNYFEELRSRSFFERKKDKYVMHDLINDLARHVSGYFCARLEDCQFKDVHQGIQVKYDLPREVLHCSYLSSDDDTLKRLRGLVQAQGLRTFLFSVRSTHRYNLGDMSKIFSDILPKLRHIRALSLLNSNISVIQDTIGDLKHLRLLNLAGNDIYKLPNDITKCLNLQTLILKRCKNLHELPEDMGLLFNLQTLILEGCYSLRELPEDMRLLINLQHLDVRGCTLLAKMRIWLSILKDIQNLSIVVDHIHGSALEQLDKVQVGQFLTISNLGNAVTVKMARNAELKNKNCIEILTLRWSNNPYCSEDDSNILAELIPHTNIREISIKLYRGTAFPNWVGDSSFCNLESLALYGCNNCIHLPPLGQLPGLKRLQIWGMDGISEIGEEFYGSSSISKPFPVLEELAIRWCKKLKSLPEQMHTQLSSLRSLEIVYCPEMECFPNGGLPPSLKSLDIWSCEKLTKFLSNWGLQRLQFLVHLTIDGIEDKLFPEEGLLPATLQQLDIWSCPNLEALNVKGFQHITSLEELEIWDCPELRCLPEDGLPSSLFELHIRGCPKLEGRIERGKGEDWPKIAHIPDIRIDGRRI